MDRAVFNQVAGNDGQSASKLSATMNAKAEVRSCLANASPAPHGRRVTAAQPPRGRRLTAAPPPHETAI